MVCPQSGTATASDTRMTSTNATTPDSGLAAPLGLKAMEV